MWAPQPGPQQALVDCPYTEIGFGGARGGGKTDGILGKYAIKGERYGRHFNAVFFRKEMPQQDDLIERAKEIYLPCGGTWYEQKKLFVLSGGGRIRFRALESVVDAEKYQGQNLSDAAVEEAGNYPSAAPIDRLYGALRSRAGVPIQLLLSFNPGGPGHSWLKERYEIRQNPFGMSRIIRKLPNGKLHYYTFIPSKVKDNKILMEKDPDYVNRLHLVGSAELVRAWLEGDWEIRMGAFFEEFGQRHILPPMAPQKHWERLVGFDWGFNSPYCAVWGAISSGKDDEGNEVPYPKGSIIIYRESWGKGLNNDEIGAKIKGLSEGEDPLYIADPSIFNHMGGASIAEQLRNAGVNFRRGDNHRPSGASQIRLRLKADVPMLYITTSCPYLIETMSGLPTDPKNAEDCDTTANDHAYDALRYLCKARVIESSWPKPVPESKMGKVVLTSYVATKKRDREQSRL